MKIENLDKFLSEAFKQSGNQPVKVYELTRKVKYGAVVYKNIGNFFQSSEKLKSLSIYHMAIRQKKLTSMN